jgi:hypothetical protein
MKIKLFLFLFLVGNAFAGVSPHTHFKGNVVSFDERFVQFQSGSEQFLIPRSFFPRGLALKENLHVTLSLNQEQANVLNSMSRSLPRKKKYRTGKPLKGEISVHPDHLGDDGAKKKSR